MKKTLLILIIHLFLFNVFFGKTNNAFSVFENYEKATIHFLDGTSIKGLAKIIKNYKIKFKLSENSKPDIWSDVLVKGITFHDAYIDYVFEYIYVSYDFCYLAEIIEDGYMKLYFISETNWVLGSFNSSTMFPNNRANYSFIFYKETER